MKHEPYLQNLIHVIGEPGAAGPAGMCVCVVALLSVQFLIGGMQKFPQ